MKKTIAFCLTLWCASTLFADPAAMPRFAIPTARSNGMGGDHVAYTDNVFSLLVNPAAIMRTRQNSAFTIAPTLFSPERTFGLIDPIMTMINSGNIDELTNAGNLLKGGKIPLGFELREFPLSIAHVSDGFGFGIWDRIFVNPNIIGTTVKLDAFADVIVPIGMAFKILDTGEHIVDFGFTVKPFARVKLSEQRSLMDMLGTGNGDMLEDVAVPVIAGAGFDIGFMYRWDIGLSAGLTFDDIITRGAVVTNLTGSDNNSYFVPFSMNLGVACDVKIGRFWASAPNFLANTGITLAFDWHDVTNAFQQNDYTKRNAILDIGVGLQLSLMDMIKLRIGMNEMLPAVGLGLKFGLFELDVAYYGKELGREPGQLPAPALDVSIAFRPKAKPRDRFWTRGSLVGLITKSDKKAPPPADDKYLETEGSSGYPADDPEAAAGDAVNRMDDSLDASQ
ncbi:MAG: hypothetical protein LBB48_06575 [Treponema sp.]|jgi:hypothetical protein|nr:hypothetical protein [Treponema sp.]